MFRPSVRLSFGSAQGSGMREIRLQNHLEKGTHVQNTETLVWAGHIPDSRKCLDRTLEYCPLEYS